MRCWPPHLGSQLLLKVYVVLGELAPFVTVRFGPGDQTIAQTNGVERGPSAPDALVRVLILGPSHGECGHCGESDPVCVSEAVAMSRAKVLRSASSSVQTMIPCEPTTREPGYSQSRTWIWGATDGGSAGCHRPEAARGTQH